MSLVQKKKKKRLRQQPNHFILINIFRPKVRLCMYL